MSSSGSLGLLCCVSTKALEGEALPLEHFEVNERQDSPFNVVVLSIQEAREDLRESLPTQIIRYRPAKFPAQRVSNP